MAESPQELSYAAQLHQDSLGLSEADAQVAAEPIAADETPGEVEGEEDGDEVSDLRERAYQRRLIEQRTQDASGANGAGANGASPLAQAAGAVGAAAVVGGSAAEAALKKVQDRFRWSMWIAIIGGTETVIISVLAILALDILYIAQKFNSSIRRFVPKPHIAEVIALIVLTVLILLVLMCGALVQLLPIYLLGKIPGVETLLKIFHVI